MLSGSSKEGVVCAVLSVLQLAAADGFVAPIYNFLSRPDIRTPRLQVDTYDPSEVAPGYIFLTPWAPEAPFGTNFDFGPAIYDNYGELVWTGYNPKRPKLDGSMGFFVTQYDGKPHIGYSQGGRPGLIHGDILDQHYHLVRRVTVGETPVNSYDDLLRDMHEFKVITPPTLAVSPSNWTLKERTNWVQATDPATALLVAITVRPVDPPVNMCGTEISWVRDFPFQEVSLDGENKIVFEWNPLEHIPIQETKMCPGMMDHLSLAPSRQGTSSLHPFDYVHRNSVDKLPDGDFVMSARHMNTIYKISHVDGHIIWRLGGGRKTDFNQMSIVPGVDLEFAFQHDVRVANDIPGADSANGIIGLTLWDNANARYDGKGAYSDRSRGKTILVNQQNMTATLVSAFALPGNSLGTNQGSHQALSNGNHIIGGGNIAQVVEYSGHGGIVRTPDGQMVVAMPAGQAPVFAAHFGGGPMNSYRARRYEWHGYPKWKPSAFAYRQSCHATNGTFVYASWNGATEVVSWKVFGATKRSPPYTGFRELATAKRAGFETIIAVHAVGEGDAHVSQMFAVALDKGGQELGRTDTIDVWIPKEEDRRVSARAELTAERRNEARRWQPGECGEKRCRHGFEYRRKRAETCSHASSDERLNATTPVAEPVT